jgi:tetratricopeptide (TPR) repeat protein
MRKFILFALLSAAAALPAAAQDATPTPSAESAPSQTPITVPVVVAGDVFDRAGTAFDAGDYQTAISEYSLFILLNPGFAEAYYSRGVSYAALNLLDDALADLQTALDLPAPSAELTGRAHLVRFSVYLQQGKETEAMTEADAAIAAAPDLSDAYYNRGAFYAAQNDYARALTDYNEMVRLLPDDPGAFNERGHLHVQMGDLQAAMDDYSEVVRLSPEEAGGYANRAGIYIEQQAYELALTDLTEALRLRPDAVGLYLQRGMVQSLLGNTALAAADYLDWIQSQQKNTDATHLLRSGESQVVELDQGMVYVFSFEGRAGQTVTLSATSRTAGVTDPLLVLLNPQGDPIAADDDSGGNYDAALTDLVLPIDGIYGLVVSHAGGGSDGAVRVLLTAAP